MNTYISTKLRGAFRYVKFTEEEQNEKDFEKIFLASFIDRALAIHDVHTEEEIVIEFFDNNGAPINESDLFEIIGQKSSCGCFYIELLVSGESHKSITPEQLRNYLAIKKNSQYIINEHDRTGSLTKKTRVKLVEFLSQLIDEEYSGIATPKEIESICFAAVSMFSSLKDKDGGIKMLYNTNSGYLYDKLRNKDRAQKRISQPDGHNEQNVTATEAELVQFFKNCVIQNEIDELKQKLQSTIELRRRILKNPPQPIHEMFSFYYADPELILYDFQLFFNETNANALIDMWPIIKNKPHDVHNIRIDSDFIVPTVDGDILGFLHLIKFLPAPRIKFEGSVNAFIKFDVNSNTDPMKMIEPRNPHPIILAVITNTNETEHKKFYIGCQERVFSVPIGFDFVRVLDMYFKIHKVFNFDFNKKVKPVMTLIDNFVFKFPLTTNQSITPTIQSVANKLFEA